MFHGSVLLEENIDISTTESIEALVSRRASIVSQSPSDSIGAVRITPCGEGGLHSPKEVSEETVKAPSLFCLVDKFEPSGTGERTIPKPNEVMEPQPKPSVHPSASNPSLRAIGNRPAYVRSTSSRTGASRHSLLRSDVSRQQQAEKDSPIPPVLSQETPLSVGKDATTGPNPTTVLVPSRESSRRDLDLQRLDLQPIESSSAPAELFTDPSMHPIGTPAMTDLPGVFPVEDVSESGLPAERGGPREETVDISKHLHGDHDATSKVQPATEYFSETVDISKHLHGDHDATSKVQPANEPIFTNRDHEGYRGISKVRSAAEYILLAGKEVLHQSAASAQNIAKEIYSVEEHFRHSRHDTPKVGAFVEAPPTEKAVLGGNEIIHQNSSSAQAPPKEIYLVDEHFRHSNIDTPKVSPFVGHPAIEAIVHQGKEIIHQSEPSAHAAPKEAYPIEEHLRHRHIDTPKVKPFVERPTVKKEIIHQSEPSAHAAPKEAYPIEEHLRHRHIDTPKVRPFLDRSSVTASQENSIPRVAVQRPMETSQDIAESSTGTSYWDFLPAFRKKDNRAEKFGESNTQSLSGGAVDPVENGGPLPGSKGASSNVSRSGTQQSLSESQRSGPPKNAEVIFSSVAKMAESEAKGDNPPHEIEGSRQRLSDVNSLEARTVPDDKAENGMRSSKSILPISHPRLSEDEVDQPRRISSPERLDPRRTATWLRQLLGQPEPGGSKLTKLPEKRHPRHQAHEDYSNDEVTAMASRVTTFSGRDAADAGAMSTAMHNLENLLSEALQIANEVSEQDDIECGHIDDGDLRLQGISEGVPESSYPASTHESVRSSSSDDYDSPVLATIPQHTFVGSVEGLTHGCEALPLRAVKRRGLAQPDMHNGNVRGPALPRRNSSVRGSRESGTNCNPGREIRHHVADDDYVLPMPPPDRQLRRQSIFPPPHAYDEDDLSGTIKPRTEVPNSREVREYIRVFHQPPIAPRQSSRNLREVAAVQAESLESSQTSRSAENRRRDVSVCSLDGSTTIDDVIDFTIQYSTGGRQSNGISGLRASSRGHKDSTSAENPGPSHQRHAAGAATGKRGHVVRNISLRKKSHVSLRDDQGFNLTKSVKRQPTIARDWSPVRKRLVAAVACISTALIGILIGIYAGLVPSVQYYIADFNHYAILGNVGMYLGMALSTFFCWPLPLLHGRKPYIVCSLCVAMPLLFPQAIAVSALRSPYTSAWRWALLLPRAVMGFTLGFASMNFHSILTDLFGASLMSGNPHQETVDHCDVRRHGGGLGVWLGIWTWCFIGSLGVGFLVGAVIIDRLPPSWGFYVSIMLLALVLLLNVLCPEVRRSAWRRSVAEVKHGSTISRRVARGEIKMHRVQTGPKWWGQEMFHGAALSLEMLRQPGFTVIAVYSAWIYAQVVLIIVLLGSLTSRHYRLHSTYVGAAVSSVAIGALVAVPFQKANLFSRARKMGPRTNSMTFVKKVTWTSHLVRRAIFTIVLPVCGILYTVVSAGPPVHLFFPCFFAALIGFLSCLAIAECNGLLMEAWDCSDLQPGMTGHPPSSDTNKRTNYSSFPRVTAGLNTIHSIGFIFAAGATGIGGIATRSLSQRAATGVVASILFLFSLLLLGVLIRFRNVQIVADCKCEEMDKWKAERRDSHRRRASAIAVAKASGLKDHAHIPEDEVG
ncbi:Uu.00g097780.m01.CDS01 [Anthostomella pinea]|uniref:Uu.00g097780.m01.CDS01 n=1 Tax=Anthostomella pinea TaxID=933095 RepID=A0AAI8VCH3_9PEZI|nr:Uu.00g097780.m01.CDS01 [Anthostomella pinea]